jgi:putative flippase GtrA
VAPSPTALLDRITRGKADKLVRFGMVSVVGVVITQVLLILFHGILDIGAIVSNLVAVSLSSAPVFLLNKRWVWGKDGRSHFRKEVLPFWGFTLLGLLLSTVLVAIADHISNRTWPVLVANISGFGIVWLAKFLFLDSVIWGDDAAAAA